MTKVTFYSDQVYSNRLTDAVILHMPFIRTLSSLDQWFTTDARLHKLYPEPIQLLAERHWTPLAITQMVVEFLATHPGARILDIGSGVGKFCLAGAYYKPQATFFGVEQREHLIDHAQTAKDALALPNVHFIHSNITQLDFKQFDHFYFFNSFYENLLSTDKIDNTISHSPYLFKYYHRQLYKKLEEMPAGTRLATFHCMKDVVPPGYFQVEERVGTLLKYWLKI